MIRFRLFKQVNHQTFDFKPRFYDPEKEALEERVRQYKELSDSKSDLISTKERIKSGLRSKQGGYRADQNYRRNAIRRSNIRLVLIVAILCALCMAFLQSNKLDQLLSLLF